MAIELNDFVVDPMSRFRDVETGRKVEFGAWRPEFHAYCWVGDTQYLLLSNQATVWFEGEEIRLDIVERAVSYKDMVSLARPGTYAMVRKKRVL